MRQTPRHTPARLAAALLGFALVATTAACGSSNGSAAGGCDTPGVSGSEIQLGTLASLTGGSSSVWAPFAQGVEARIDLQNDQGGINGRKLALSTSDDASDTARNLSGGRELVEGHDVLALFEGSANTGGSGDYLGRKNVPVVGFGYAPEFQTHKNFVSFDNVNPGFTGLATVSALWGQFLASKGAQNVYVVGNAAPSSSKGAAALSASVTAAGLKVGALTANLPLGNTNYGGEVAKAKSAGTDSVAMTHTPTAELALIAALRQAGVDMKTILVSTGYDPSVLSAGVNLEGMSVPVAFAPFELNLPAHKTFNDAVVKYTHAAPNQSYSMYGWLSADLVIKGITDAGACPTREGVLNAINALRGYTADGLIPATDYTADTRGTVLKCDYFVTVHNNAFVTENNGEPICVKGDQFAIKYS